MRRIATVLGIGALALAGCGDDSGSSSSSSSLDAALGYLPADSPLVVAIDTDVEGDQFKALQSIADKLPFGDQISQSLLEELGVGGADFEKEVKPLLGKEFVVGATDVSSIIDDSEDDDFVAAIQAKDKDALDDAVKEEGADEKGEQGGAKLYTDSDGDEFAIEDDVLIVAGSDKLLESALAQRDADDHLTEDTFNDGLDGLPDNALIKVYSDIGALVKSDPAAKDALKVPWIEALGTLGLTASIQEDEVAVDFNVATDSGDLSEEDLPLAPGSDAPAVIKRNGEIGVAVRDLNHIFEFAQNTAQAIDPSGFGDFERAKQQIESRLGVSVDDDLFGQLTDDVTVSISIGGGFGARAALKDPDAFKQTLDKLAPVLPSIAENIVGPGAKVRRDGDRYALIGPNGPELLLGVVDDALVVASDPARARQVSSAQPESVEGAKGSLVFAANAEALVDSVLGQLGGLEGIGGQLFTGPLGELSGSVESSTDGLRGSLTLGID